MRLSVAIQTHPDRAHLAAALAAQIPGAVAISDPDPDAPLRSPWRTYRRALEETPLDATNRLIVQDDVTLCRDFARAATAAVAARSDRMIVFFVSRQAVNHANRVWRACDRGESWAELDPMRWCPVVATCWPVAMIRPFLDYVDAQGWPPAFRADDEIVGRWLRSTRQAPLATVPSLVEHEDATPSLIRARHRQPRAPRTAACFIHPDCDPASIDWSIGPV